MKPIFWCVGCVGCLWAWHGTKDLTWIFFAGIELGFAYDAYLAAFR